MRDLAVPAGKVEPEEISTTFNDRDVNALKSQAELEAMAIENKLRAEELKQRSGFKACGFNLSDGVLIAIVTTTTANVIGIFAFVMMYLFNTGNKSKDKNR